MHPDEPRTVVSQAVENTTHSQPEWGSRRPASAGQQALYRQCSEGSQIMWPSRPLCDNRPCPQQVTSSHGMFAVLRKQITVQNAPALERLG
jgi:hypothetical protein